MVPEHGAEGRIHMIFNPVVQSGGVPTTKFIYRGDSGFGITVNGVMLDLDVAKEVPYTQDHAGPYSYAWGDTMPNFIIKEAP